MILKICNRCDTEKPLCEFHKNKMGVNGCRSICSSCTRISAKEYKHTKDGLICAIYGRQRRVSRRRGHSKPEYSLKQLRAWMKNQKIFHDLYDEWVVSGFNRMLSPSCDRTDNSKGYSFERLNIVTWQENYNNYRFRNYIK